MQEPVSPNTGFVARLYVESVNLGLIGAAGSRRQRHYGSGERAPASIARPAVDLTVVERREPGRKPKALTEVGQKTAVRRLSRVLAKLAADDPRLLVARIIATAAAQQSARAFSFLNAGLDGRFEKPTGNGWQPAPGRWLSFKGTA